MIPDKIYIRHYWMPGELDDDWRLKPVEDEQCEEYIRKDALLEWANDNLLECEVSNDDTDYGRIDVYKKLIDKIKSL